MIENAVLIAWLDRVMNFLFGYREDIKELRKVNERQSVVLAEVSNDILKGFENQYTRLSEVEKRVSEVEDEISDIKAELRAFLSERSSYRRKDDFPAT